MPHLDMCSEYVATIQRFVETRRAYEWGLVAQALAGAMRHVLQVGTAVASAQMLHISGLANGTSPQLGCISSACA